MAKREPNEDWLKLPDPIARRVLHAAREMRHAPTDTENLLWNELRGRKLEGRKFRRQQPIGAFIVDFFCADAALAVEVDGGVHHGQAGADAARQRAIEATGVRFVRVSDELVRTNVVTVLERISLALGPTIDPAPPPLRSSERGPGGEAATREHEDKET